MSSTFSTTNGRSGDARSSLTDTLDKNSSMNDAIQRKASDLLATNPEIRDIILRAESSGKLRWQYMIVWEIQNLSVILG